MQLNGIGAVRAKSGAKVTTDFDYSAFTEYVVGVLDRDRAESDRAWAKAQRILDVCEEKAIQVLALGEAESYPERLSVLAPSGKSKRDLRPAMLFVRGSVDALRCPGVYVAVVGTRKPTAKGVEAAESIGRRCARLGVTVVSGLAYGCDYWGHEGCVDEGGTAVAIMAHGLDLVYPPEHRELAERIIDTGGCLVSEYPPGQSISRYAFVERDRLQSALSDIVVIVQTGVRGGTQHTAAFARDQERMLVCVAPDQGDLASEMVQGNLDLIAGGARSIESSMQLMEIVGERQAQFSREMPLFR